MLIKIQNIVINTNNSKLIVLDVSIFKKTFYFLFPRMQVKFNFPNILCTFDPLYGDVAQLARALDWQSRGRGFESHLLHKILCSIKFLNHKLYRLWFVVFKRILLLQTNENKFVL